MSQNINSVCSSDSKVQRYLLKYRFFFQVQNLVTYHTRDGLQDNQDLFVLKTFRPHREHLFLIYL